MSRVMSKPAFCIFEKKDSEADQRLCFRYLAKTIPLIKRHDVGP